jgi:hypothetical protein
MRNWCELSLLWTWTTSGSENCPDAVTARRICEPSTGFLKPTSISVPPRKSVP